GIHRAVVEALPRSLFGQLSAYISVASILATDIKKTCCCVFTESAAPSEKPQTGSENVHSPPASNLINSYNLAAKWL
ncbi:MAG: hypothetical protein ACRC8E_09535, partial [Plesiomonas shigelloides]